MVPRLSPTAAPAPESEQWGASKSAGGVPPIEEALGEFSLGDGVFMHTPPRRSYSMTRGAHVPDGPRDFSLEIQSDDAEFAELFAEGELSVKITASTTDELQSHLAAGLLLVKF